jgi:hypothetical protein
VHYQPAAAAKTIGTVENFILPKAMGQQRAEQRQWRTHYETGLWLGSELRTGYLSTLCHGMSGSCSFGYTLKLEATRGQALIEVRVASGQYGRKDRERGGLELCASQ